MERVEHNLDVGVADLADEGDALLGGQDRDRASMSNPAGVL
jgi:hypothetical protein